MDYIIYAPEMDLPANLNEVDAYCVYAAFEKITDGRCKRGIRYPVALILTLIVLAKLMGEPKLSGVSQWVRLRGTWLNEVLHLQRTRWPAASTYTYVLERLDEQEVTRVMQECLTRAETSRRCGEEPSRLATQAGCDQSAHIAMDGKTMRGTLGHEAANQPSVHLLSLYEVKTGTVLAQRAVATKENEISAAPALVTPELIKGRIYSADAMHTQKNWCRQVTRAGGDYLLIAKNNQSTLREDLALFLDDPEADRRCWQTASTCNKGHGRLEKRTLMATTELNEFLARDWAEVGQVFRLERTVLKKGVWHTTLVYGLTSLSPAQASSERLLGLNRGHWGIENRLHYRRDVTDGGKITPKFALAVLPRSWLLSITRCWHLWTSCMSLMFPIRCVSIRLTRSRLFDSYLSSFDFRKALPEGEAHCDSFSSQAARGSFCERIACSLCSVD